MAKKTFNKLPTDTSEQEWGEMIGFCTSPSLILESTLNDRKPVYAAKYKDVFCNILSLCYLSGLFRDWVFAIFQQQLKHC